MHRVSRAPSLLACLFFVSGCVEMSGAVLPPIADAGVGTVVVPGTLVTLDGTGSRTGEGEQAGLEYEWSLVHRPKNSQTTLSRPEVSAPRASIDVVGDYAFRLVVRHDGLSSRPDVVVVTCVGPLDVLSQTPPSGAYGVSLLAPIAIQFSRPIQPDSLGSSGIHLLSEGNLVRGVVTTSDGNTVAVFTPLEPLPPNSLVTVFVTREVVGLDGMGLPANYRGSFATANGADVLPPGIARVTPSADQFDVLRDSAVVVFFDEAIDAEFFVVDSDEDGCYDNYRLSDAAGTCIQAVLEISAGNTRATLTPTDVLVPGTYDVEVLAAAVRDLAGNVMAGSALWSFSVSTASDSTPPRVASIYPGPGYTEVPVGAKIIITFSKPVEPASVSIGSVSLSAQAGEFAATRSLSGGNRVLTLAPRSLLVPNSSFTVIVRGQGASVVTDRNGVSLDGDGDGVAGSDYWARFVTTSNPCRDGSFDLVDEVIPGHTIVVSLNDRDLNTSGAPDTTAIVAYSSSGEQETIELTETLGSSGIFQGSVATRYSLGAGIDDDGVFNTQKDDRLTFAYDDRCGADGVAWQIVHEIVVLQSPAAIGISDISNNTDEAGGTAVFSVALAAEPTATVTVNFHSSDTSEGTLSTSNLVFTTNNWNVPQSVDVVGIDDDVVDGDQSYAIQFDLTVSTDGAYAALTPSDIPAVNVDDDVAGFLVEPSSSLSTTEGGGTASFTVALTSEPTADVTVVFHSSATAEGNVSAGSLTFTPANWSDPQAVTVTGVDDAIADGDQLYRIDFDAAASADPIYNGMVPANVNVTNGDDDTVGFAIDSMNNSTTEGGATANFDIALTSEPLAAVTVNFSSSDPSEGVTDVNSLTFTPGDWDVPQTVTVTGVDDAIDDGDQPYEITFGAITSVDPLYPDLTPESVSMNNVDDDTAAIVVSLISGPTTTAGGTATFSMVLATEPTANVTVFFDSNDTTEGVADVSFATFTPANGSVVQIVTVTGVDDAAADEPQTYGITFSATASADATYAAIIPTPVVVENVQHGADGVPEILQAEFTVGTEILVRVVGDTDMSANATAGAGNDTLAVTLSSSSDSETVVLTESMVAAGWFDCTSGGCGFPTANSSAPTPDNGFLEIDGADTVTLEYVDAVTRDGSVNAPVSDDATAIAPGGCVVNVVINEIVVDPQQDWSDSADGDGNPFNGVPGSGMVDANDQWIELYNAGSCTVDLTGYILHLLDRSGTSFEFGATAQGQSLVFSDGGTLSGFLPGEYLVVGDVSGLGFLDESLWVRLDEPGSGGIVDDVALGSHLGGDGEPSNNAPSGMADEAIARSPNGQDTGADDSDFVAGSATIGSANP